MMSITELHRRWNDLPPLLFGLAWTFVWCIVIVMYQPDNSFSVTEGILLAGFLIVSVGYLLVIYRKL
ncbi:MAG: hypothetical protein U9N35_04025 [Euryarchaeota archaeon]|nr:hypothetical protein [Euryarchaeota archaeon]